MEQTTIPKITLTEKAAQKARQFLGKEKKKALRLDVLKGGCSVYTYEIGLESEPKEGDAVIEDQGIKIFVGKEGSVFMNGSTVDFVSSLNNSGFKIHNPNVKRTCGCGHSVG